MIASQPWPLNLVNPFPADVAKKRHLGSSKSLDRENWSDWLVWPNDSFFFFFLPGVFILQTDAKRFNVFTNTLNWLKIDSVNQKLFKFNWPESGNFSQGAGTPGTDKDIAFSQLAVKGLIVWTQEWQLKTIYRKFSFCGLLVGTVTHRSSFTIRFDSKTV
jgi:hypothetical protein